MTITLNSSLHIYEPTDDVLNYIKLNLVVSNPEYAKKQRMGFWVGNTPEKIHLYEKVGDEYILPYGCFQTVLKMGYRITPDFSDSPYVVYNCDIPLYDYQQKAVEGMYHSKYGILEAPAGSGKTQMAIALASKIGKRTLWITHTQDLLKQSYNRAKQYIDESLLGTITEGKVNISEGMTFATIQTLSKVDIKPFYDFFDTIICDECHRVSGNASTLTMYYKALSQLSARHKYGISATLHRSDGMIRSTFALLGGIKYSVSEEDVGDKIVNVGIKPIATDVAVSEDMLNYDGTLNYTNMINTLTVDTRRNGIIAEQIIKNKGHSCLILSDRIDHLITLKQLLPCDMQNDARVIHGKMTTKSGKADREKFLEEMRSGEAKYLFASYSLAKEGLDVPRLDRLFMATPVKDYSVVVQSIGRIARKFDGKEKPICYDFVDNIGFLKKAYKKRWTSYRKINCYEVTE